MKESVLTSAVINSEPEETKVLTYDEIVSQYGSDYRDENPAVYCSTYYKYNNGSLFGTWLDLTKFADYDEFISVCRQLHSDEDDPELMFQDYECFPRTLYCESCMGEETFDQIIEYSNLDDDEKKAFREYLDLGYDYDMDAFHEAYEGKWDSEEEFAEHLIDECYNLEEMMGSLSIYFDYKHFADELFSTDYTYSDGYVFRS